LTVSVWLLSTYFIVLILLIVLEKRKSIVEGDPEPKNLPLVSLIVPAFNEKRGVLPALRSLGEIDYPRDKYEVIIVNDGSSDGTAEIISDFISTQPGVPFKFIDRKENKGKAFSLNEGIAASKGDYVGTMDADSLVKPDILRKTVGFFEDPKTGAVTVRVHVHKPKNLLERIVDVEYVVGLSLSLKILSYLNSMHVTPGPFSIYRKSMLEEIGGFDVNNIVEDMEIAFRMHKAGYKIKNTLATGVYTIVPSTLGELYKQRKRWYSGSLITLMQHKDVMFNRGLGAFGIFFMPINYATITLGLALGLYSFGMLLNNIWRNLNYLWLTNFEMLPPTFELDILNLSIFHFIMLSSILSISIMTKVSLSVMQRRLRENVVGFLGFLFFFVIYQVFWASSFYSVFLGREIKWR